MLAYDYSTVSHLALGALEFVARVPADHGLAADLFLVVELSYQDGGSENGTQPLTGTASIRLNVE